MCGNFRHSMTTTVALRLCHLWPLNPKEDFYLKSSGRLLFLDLSYFAMSKKHFSVISPSEYM